MESDISFSVDGERRSLTVDVRTTLLDALRERLDTTSVKKGCDHGQCGSCTVLLNGRRHLSCLTLAVAHDGDAVITAAGLADGDGELHPVQRAFLRHDGYQCGYCTPGQICSAIGMLEEIVNGHRSHATVDLGAEPQALEDEIRERMSGNLCRCGAYVGILDAIKSASQVIQAKG